MVSMRLLDKWEADIESEYAPRIRELQTELRELQEQRERDLAVLAKLRSELDGEEQLSLSPNEPDEETSSENGSRVVAAVVKDFTAANNAVANTRPRPIKEDVRDIVSGFEDEVEITQGDVRERYLQMHPEADADKVRPSISHSLRQLMEEGELERVAKGVASVPHRYRRTKSREQSVSD